MKGLSLQFSLSMSNVMVSNRITYKNLPIWSYCIFPFIYSGDLHVSLLLFFILCHKDAMQKDSRSKIVFSRLICSWLVDSESHLSSVKRNENWCRIADSCWTFALLNLLSSMCIFSFTREEWVIIMVCSYLLFSFSTIFKNTFICRLVNQPSG